MPRLRGKMASSCVNLPPPSLKPQRPNGKMGGCQKSCLLALASGFCMQGASILSEADLIVPWCTCYSLRPLMAKTLTPSALPLFEHLDASCFLPDAPVVRGSFAGLSDYARSGL